MNFGVALAKNNLPKLLKLVESGENIIVTRHGKPVVQIRQLPPEFLPQKDDSLDDAAFDELLCPAYLKNILRS
jgi:antitoxin (DNA-binding transcriptional repressor) of toxin-antitoxin stability system